MATGKSVEAVLDDLRKDLRRTYRTLPERVTDVKFDKSKIRPKKGQPGGTLIEPTEFTTIRSSFDPTNFFEEIFEGAFNNLLRDDPSLYKRLLTQFRDKLKSLTFTDAELKLMRDHVRNRIFVHGLGNKPAPNRAGEYGSADTQMRLVSKDVKDSFKYPAIAYSKYKYRYKTGQLYKSVKVRQTSANLRLIIEYRRETKIINNLIGKFGNFFKPTASDVNLYYWLILKKFGLLQGQTRPAPKGFGGVSGPIPSYSKNKPGSFPTDPRAYLRQFS